jgi:hypothetical protein
VETALGRRSAVETAPGRGCREDGAGGDGDGGDGDGGDGDGETV